MKKYRKKLPTLFRNQNGKCFYCDSYVSFDKMTIDHIIPKSKGGGNKKKNLVASCYPCNSAKGDKSVEEFYKIIHNNFFWHA